MEGRLEVINSISPVFLHPTTRMSRRPAEYSRYCALSTGDLIWLYRLHTERVTGAHIWTTHKRRACTSAPVLWQQLAKVAQRKERQSEQYGACCGTWCPCSGCQRAAVTDRFRRSNGQRVDIWACHLVMLFQRFYTRMIMKIGLWLDHIYSRTTNPSVHIM